MKGKWIYAAFFATFGILASFGNLLVSFILFFFVLGMGKLKGFSKKEYILFLTIFFLFFVRGEMEQWRNHSSYTGDEKNFMMMFQPPIKFDGNFFSAYGKDVLRKEKVVVQYTIPTYEEKRQLEELLTAGTVCKVKGELKEPSRARNPKAFDYKSFLKNEGIFWQLKIEKMNIESCQLAKNSFLYFQQLRQLGVRYVNEHFPAYISPLANALIFGERNFIEEDLTEAYQRLGIIHLLAISGLHVSLLVVMLFYVGIRLGITREKVLNGLILFLPIYIVLAGGSPSVIRACMMTFIALFYVKWKGEKKILPIDLLSFVFVGYVFVEPFILFHVGFQLSFAVTTALILSTSMLKNMYHRPFYLTFATSFISQLAAMPILIYHFYEFSVTSMIVNLLYIPLFSMMILPIMMILFISRIIFGSFIDPIIHFFDFYMGKLHDFTIDLSNLPFHTIVLGRPDFILFISYIFSILFFFYQWEKAKTYKHVLMALLVPVGLIFFNYGINVWKLKGEVTMIDVGQGDSILIQLPFNQGTYLVDTGGTLQFPTDEWKERRNSFEVGKDILVPFLKSKGITTIDKLIITHGDMDHAGGAFALLEQIKVKEVVFPHTAELSPLEISLFEKCKEKRVSVYFASQGDRWRAGKWEFVVLSPKAKTTEDKNNASIVLYAQIGGLKWLFTGDLGVEGEEKLSAAFKNLKVDVLKVGHHGSKTSTGEKLLKKIKPKVALISVGLNNRFGHPHEEVVNRLRKHQVIIYRTDHHGAISYYFVGNKGTFLTKLP